MKKIIVVLFVAVLFANCVAADTDNLGELNLKAGLQFAGQVKVEHKNPDPNENDKTLDVNTGVVFTGEYLILLNYLSESIENFKFGVGLGYLLPREYKKNANTSIAYLPFYFTLQVNPFINAQNKNFHGIFLKGNVGVNVLFDFKDKGFPNNSKLDKTGGSYYGFSTGYEFPFGIIVDLSYDVYCGSIKVSHYASTNVPGDKNYFANDVFSYKNVTFNIGYKFKI